MSGSGEDGGYYRGYVAGVARAWRRGNVTWGHVAGAVRFARRRGLPDDEIVSALRMFDIEWEPASDRLRPGAVPSD